MTEDLDNYLRVAGDIYRLDDLVGDDEEWRPRGESEAREIASTFLRTLEDLGRLLEDFHGREVSENNLTYTQTQFIEEVEDYWENFEEFYRKCDEAREHIQKRETGLRSYSSETIEVLRGGVEYQGEPGSIEEDFELNKEIGQIVDV